MTIDTTDILLGVSAIGAAGIAVVVAKQAWKVGSSMVKAMIN